MQEQKYSELEERSVNAIEAEAAKVGRFDLIKKLEAQVRVHAEIEAMKAEGKALSLSDEEIDMLRSFRRFKLRMRKDGEVFTWQTRRPEGVQITEDSALVIHPSEASSEIR